MRHSSLRVLVVEDSAPERMLLVDRLRELGVRHVRETGNVQTALELVQQAPRPDVVVCDMKGPELDGLDLVRRIGEQRLPVQMVLVQGCHQAMLQSAVALAEGYGLAVAGVLGRGAGPEEMRGALDRVADTMAAEVAVVYDPPPDLRRLTRALVDGSLGAEFQPQIALGSGEVVGSEALLRWVGPSPPSVGARAMVVALEEGGQMRRLTEMMLRRAAEESVRWQERGRTMRVAVNISAGLLDDVSLVEDWVAIVAQVGARTDLITFELTEDALVADLDVALQVMRRLGEAGFNLAMDDFGTGYSTLSLLGRLPLTELKVDRSLVQGVAEDWRRRALVEAVLGLCTRLGLRSVAEGVETHEDLAVLRELGCDVAQGWLFAPAMHWADFADFVDRDVPGDRLRAGVVEGLRLSG